MKNIKKLIRNFLVFVVLIAITLWVILKDQSIEEVVEVFSHVKMRYVYIGISSMTVYLLLEGINMRRTLNELGEKVSIMQAFKYSLIGFFFSSITPAASGGQPMQIYYMHKDKIQVSNSTLALIINLASMQIITISMAFISLVLNYSFMNKVLITFFIVGISLNASALFILIAKKNKKRLSKWLIKLAVKIMILFRIRNIWSKKRKLMIELKSYQSSALYIRNNKKLMVKTITTTFIQFTFYYSISYWTYLSLGFNGHNILELITMQSILFATVSGIPSPGAVGVSEGAFIEIYRNIYPTNMLKSATLITRGINFYLFVLISGIVVIVNEIRNKEKEV